MDLDEYHYHDGRPVSFDRAKVIHLEPHESGSGTFVRLAFEGGSQALHLQEDYEFLKKRLAENWVDRAISNLNEKREAGETVDDFPF